MSPRDLVNLTYISTGHEITRRDIIARRERKAHRDVLDAPSSRRYPSQALKHAAVQQNLALAPPLPILNIGMDYILGQIGADATIKGNRSLSYSENNTQQRSNRKPHSRRTKLATLSKRVDGPIQCGAGNPCADGSCCNSVSQTLNTVFAVDRLQEGKCGFKPYHCNPEPPVTCLSNCNAKAMCGVDSPGGALKCGLNLCCSYFGWCGVSTT